MKQSRIAETIFFFLVQSRSFLHSMLSDVPFRSLHGRDEKMKEKKDTTRQCRQLEKRRNSWSVSDIIVVGVNGMGKSRVGRKEEKCDQTHAEESRSHMHRSGGDDTIWSFVPEACDNIMATCYVPHGRRHAWELLTFTRRTQPPTRVGRQRLHTCQGEGNRWFSRMRV